MLTVDTQVVVPKLTPIDEVSIQSYVVDAYQPVS